MTNKHEDAFDENPLLEPKAIASMDVQNVARQYLTGILLCCIAALFQSLQNLTIKFVISNSFPVGELLFLRMIPHLLILIPVLKFGGTFFDCQDENMAVQFFGTRNIRFLLFLRGVFGFLSNILFFLSMMFLTLSDATALSYTSSIWTGILGAFILKEFFNCAQIFGILLSVSGVFVLSRPSFLFGRGFEESSVAHSIGVVLALASATTSCGNYIVSRKLLQQKVNPAVLSWYHGIVSLSGASMWCIVLWKQNQLRFDMTALSWVAIFISGISALLGQLCYQVALRYVAAAVTSSLMNLAVFMSFFFDALIFHVPLYLTSILGAAAILASTLMFALCSPKPKVSGSQTKTLLISPEQEEQVESYP
jgi:drug/metabolite transporter (DMT)-like permease